MREQKSIEAFTKFLLEIEKNNGNFQAITGRKEPQWENKNSAIQLDATWLNFPDFCKGTIRSKPLPLKLGPLSSEEISPGIIIRAKGTKAPQMMIYTVYSDHIEITGMGKIVPISWFNLMNYEYLFYGNWRPCSKSEEQEPKPLLGMSKVDMDNLTSPEGTNGVRLND